MVFFWHHGSNNGLRRFRFKKLVFLGLVILECGDAWIHSSTQQRASVANYGRRHQASLWSTSEPILGDEVDGVSIAPEGQTERNLRFAGVGRLYTDESQQSQSGPDQYIEVIDRLTRATVVVVGLGGVGSWAAEALARSGIGNLCLIDLDDICISNTNRQIQALSSTVGRMKIDEMKRRLLDINPECNITLIHDFVVEDNVHEILDSLLPNVTALIDGIDGAGAKAALLAACADRKIPVVTSGGAAGRMDPTKIVYGDITKVTDDKLLSACRKTMRKYYGFGKGLSFQEQHGVGKKKQKKWRLEAVYSLEEQKSLPPGSDDSTSSFRRCDSALGTSCFVTGTYGFVAASRIVEMIAKDCLKPPMRPRH
jgi:tRNA A37 threonylcarbamoyladenosine dehydratase